MSKISLRYVEDYKTKNIEEGLKKAFSDLNPLENYISPKQKVLLKCDLSATTLPDEALTTHPNVVAVISDMIDKIGANVIICDNPKEFSSKNVEKMYEVTKMLNVANQGHSQLNTNFDLYKFDVKGNKTTSLTFLDIIRDVDVIINVPKLIVSEKEGLKGCVSNLFGLVASEEQEIIRGTSCSQLDLADYQLDVTSELKKKVKLNIVDAIVSREANGSQRILNLLMVGENPLDMDYTLLDIVNMNKEENPLFMRAKFYKLFNEKNEITLVGDSKEKFLRKDFSSPQKLQNSFATKVSHDYLTIRERPKVKISECKGCKTCFSCCPTGAITEGKDSNGEIYARLDLLKCIHCMKCVHTCPYMAIKIVTPPKFKHLKQKMDKRLVNKN